MTRAHGNLQRRLPRCRLPRRFKRRHELSHNNIRESLFASAAAVRGMARDSGRTLRNGLPHVISFGASNVQRPQEEAREGHDVR